MITALIRVERGPEALAATIAALVPGVADGVVGDAVVVARARDPALDLLADAAGAEFVVPAPGEDPWRAAVRAARRDWLFCIEDGDVPLDGWGRAIERFAAAGGKNGAPAAIGRLRRHEDGLGARLRAMLSAGARGPRSGDLVHVSHLAPGARPRVARLPAGIVRDPAFVD